MITVQASTLDKHINAKYCSLNFGHQKEVFQLEKMREAFKLKHHFDCKMILFFENQAIT